MHSKFSALAQKNSMGIRGKLISIFIAIKILPLLLLAWIAWEQTQLLSSKIESQADVIANTMATTLTEIGIQTSEDSIQALNDKSQEAVERLSNSTAQKIAQFLYERDNDILSATQRPLTEDAFRQFLDLTQREVVVHSEYALNDDKTRWVNTQAPEQTYRNIDVKIKENRREFHYTPPEKVFKSVKKPLYLEMTFVDLNGNELIKVTTSDQVNNERKNISHQENTYIKAETYFKELANLPVGGLYVSDVIGAYVPSKVIGPYTPASATKAGIPYEPELSAYAGKENPVGKRFQGLIRWATPYVENGKTIGYITLALDHTHLMEFTDYIDPTEARFSDISDASTGNYAFMWDYLGRNISHPRDYFITGYDPDTGKPAIPWLSHDIYEAFSQSQQSYAQFQKTLAPYDKPGGTSKPSITLKKQGNIALDCRYLDFASQCAGWHNLTSDGGSGSFMIYWSSIWKLTTASTIPYYSGQYGNSKRGFGFVTIGINVNQFHQAALESKDSLIAISERQKKIITQQKQDMLRAVTDNLNSTTEKLLISTTIMIVAIILIAIMIALFISRRITRIISGISQFRSGDLNSRITVDSDDEIGKLSTSFNQMADSLSTSITDLTHAQDHLEQEVYDRTKELLLTNERMKLEISERIEAQSRIQKIANFDALTGLANRSLFEEHLKQAIALSKRKHEPLGLFYFDLDGFKDVNDTKGHAVGDKLLQHIANLVKKQFRDSDTVARIGGDEFTAIISGVDQRELLGELAQNLINLLRQPVVIEGNRLQIGASVGIAICPDDAGSYQELVNIADTAMYQAKKDGGNCFHFFHPEMQKHVVLRKKLETDLRDALDNHEFTMYYQARNFADSQNIAGAEALIRWQKPDGAIINPGSFIPTAENNGFIIEIEKWVLRHVMNESKPWFDEGLMTHPIAINISYRHISRPEFSKLVTQLLNDTRFNPKNLEIEITESAVGDNEVTTINNLVHLRSLGITISIDDFGMGYSSFQRFRDLHIDILKIDRSFINNIGQHKDESIIRAITNMAHELGIQIIAEGVEEQEQLDFLLGEGCEQIQGFFFSRPMPADDFIRHLVRNSHLIVDK